jgi:hypothetical protein
MDELKTQDTREKESRNNKTKGAAIFAIAVTLTVGGLTVTGAFSSSSGLSVQTNVDLNKAISALSELKYGGKLLASLGTSSASHPTACAESATGRVRKFLTRHPCKQYAAETWAITRQNSTTDVVFAWVEMPTTSLADQYKTVVDTYGTGNSPGVSSAFNGRCYASGQQGPTVWTVEVQPTSNVVTDRKILQAAAQRKLSAAYLAKHCVM